MTSVKDKLKNVVSPSSEQKVSDFVRGLYPEHPTGESLVEMKERVRVQLLNFFLVVGDTGFYEFLRYRRFGLLKTASGLKKDQKADQLVTGCPNRDDFDAILLGDVEPQASDTLARVRRNQLLLEPINQKNDKCSMTVCIPVAIIHEDIDTIRCVMDQIKKSVGDIQGSVRVLLWMNAKQPNGISDFDESTREKYAQIRDMLQDYCGDLQVTTALEILPEENFGMSTVRSHYMDALVGEAIDGKIDVEHAVVWLDADTTHLSRNALSIVERHIDTNPQRFVHPGIDYSLEWVQGTNARELDYASKILLIDEMARRASKKSTPYEYDYPEESGMCFSLLAYLMAGGLDTGDPINEAWGLVDRYMRFFEKIAVFSYLPGDVMRVYGVSPEEVINIINQPFTMWLDDTSIRVSARRTHKILESLGVSNREVFDRSGQTTMDYTLYTDMQRSSAATPKIGRDELEKLFQSRYTDDERSLLVVERMLRTLNP